MIRRAVLALGAVALVLVSGTTSARPAEPAVPEIFEARAEAGGIHASLSVPAYFEAFTPYSLSEASNGSSHGYHALGYGGFFLTAAAGQFGFPPPPGTTETLYPQGPTQAHAEAVPVEGAAFGESSGVSSVNGSHGSATYGGGGVEGGGELGFGEATSEVVATAREVRSTASLRMQHLDFAAGTFKVGSVLATASAVSHTDGRKATNAGSVEMTDLTLLGVPVVLTPTGLELAGSPLPGVPSAPIDQLLAQAGLSLHRLPNHRETGRDGTASAFEVGGVELVFDQPAQEFKVTYTIGRMRVRSRGLPGSTAGASVELPAPAAPPEVTPAPAVPAPLATDPFAVTTRPLTPAPAPEATSPVRRVRRVSGPRGADWETIVVMLGLFVPLSLLGRRAWRAAASP